MANERRVFICYAHEDLETARRLYVDLKNLGANPWLDQEDILPGQKWQREIERSIRDSSHVLVIISRHSVSKRGFVQKELRQALDTFEKVPPDQIFIIPCRVDDSQPADGKLVELQWVDLFPSYNNGLSRIAQSLGIAPADEMIEILDEINSFRSYKSAIDKITTRVADQGSVLIGLRFQNQPLVRADLMHSIGTVYQKLGSYEEAIQHLEKALEIRREIYGDGIINIVESLHAVASVMSKKGDLDRAESFIRQALELRHQIKSEKFPGVVDCMTLLGWILFLKGQLGNAETTYRESLRLHQESSGQNSCSTATAGGIYGLAQVLHAKEDYIGAEKMYRRLLQEQFSCLGRRHPDVAVTMNSLALIVARKKERLEEAEELYEEALDIRREVLGPSHPDTALTVNNLAHLLQRKGEYAVAERLFKRSLSMFEKGVGEIHTYTAFTKYSLARLYRSIDHQEQARSWLIESLKIYHKKLGEDHPEVVMIMAEMKDLLKPVDLGFS